MPRGITTTRCERRDGSAQSRQWPLAKPTPDLGRTGAHGALHVTVSATRYNPALVACTHKLLTIINAICRLPSADVQLLQ